jgi:hypothetical protein
MNGLLMCSAVALNIYTVPAGHTVVGRVPAFAQVFLLEGSGLRDWVFVGKERTRPTRRTIPSAVLGSGLRHRKPPALLKLLQIRDDYETITAFHGFGIETLLDKCWLGRCDLSESQEQKLQKMRERSRVSVRRARMQAF